MLQHQIKLENITLSEQSQTQKDKYCMIPLMFNFIKTTLKKKVEAKSSLGLNREVFKEEGTEVPGSANRVLEARLSPRFSALDSPD